MLKFIWNLLKRTVLDWNEDKALQHGAALSYYTVFSIGPILLIAISLAGLIFGHEQAREAIVGQISGLIGEGASKTIDEILQNTEKEKSGIIATTIGFFTLLLGASGVLAQLKDSLNVIWDVQDKGGSGIKNYLVNRLISFAMVMAIGFLLLVSLIVSSLLTLVGNYWNGEVAVIQIANQFAALAMTAVLFALMFKYIPDTEIQWRDVWIGGVLTAILFNVGKYLIGLYLGKATIVSVYGAAGSLVIILLWVYYSSQILFLGAEFTQAYSALRGRHSRGAEQQHQLAEAPARS